VALSERSTASSLPRVLVTAADALFFPSLANLIGSVHVWEPDLPIIVFDLGLEPGQRAQLQQCCAVTLRTFEWSRYPPHVRPQARTYAWKAALILQVVEEAPDRAVFYEDAGQELRAPLTAVYEAVQREGYFFTTSGFAFPNTKWNHAAAFRHWNVSTEPAHWLPTRPEAIGGIVGFRRSSSVGLALLRSWVACNIQVACVAPVGTDRSNHRQDQSALNFVLYRHTELTGHVPTIHADPRYWAHVTSDDPRQQVGNNETQRCKSGVVLLSRRGTWPKPYLRHVRHGAQCSGQATHV